MCLLVWRPTMECVIYFMSPCPVTMLRAGPVGWEPVCFLYVSLSGDHAPLLCVDLLGWECVYFLHVSLSGDRAPCGYYKLGV